MVKRAKKHEFLPSRRLIEVQRYNSAREEMSNGKLYLVALLGPHSL